MEGEWDTWKQKTNFSPLKETVAIQPNAYHKCVIVPSVPQICILDTKKDEEQPT